MSIESKKPETTGADTERALHLFRVLARCGNSMMGVSRRDILSYGLKPSEFAILELLYHGGPTPLSEVASRILLTTGSITHIMDLLEKQELVKRVACPTDRRVLYAELTDTGRERIAAIFPTHAERLRQACEGLTYDEQETAIALLKKLGLYAASLDP